MQFGRRSFPVLTSIALGAIAAMACGASPVHAGSLTVPTRAKSIIQRYIVQLHDTDALNRRTARLALRGKVSRLGRTIAGMNCAVVEATPAQALRLQNDDRVLSVTPDRAVRAETTTPPLDLNRVAIGADLVNGYSGYTGSYTGAGVGVAVIDSGISAAHPDLWFRIAAFKDYVHGYDSVPYDDYGHGTHIAGLIGGSGLSGQLTGAPGNYRGIAPEVQFVGLKVLDANGAGRISDVIAALDWCVAHKSQYNLRVVNLSLSATVTGPAATDPLCQAAERAVNAGLVVVASAGNAGGLYGTVGAPGNDPKVITVGASNTRGTAGRSDDQITSFTGRGPSRYDINIKPDVVAPGNNIISLRTPGATIDTLYAAQTRLSSTPYYAQMSGTSMSAALVSGAAAVMVDANTKLTPNAVKASLMYTAQVLSGYDPVTHKTTYYDPLTQGAGELNVVGAVTLATRIRKNTGYSGTLPISSLIAGQTAPWAGSTIPQLLLRPGLTWGQSLIWGGSTGLTKQQSRSVWGSIIIWGGVGGDDLPPPKAWEDTLVWGDIIIWGGVGGDDLPPPKVDDPSMLVWGDIIIWGGVGGDDLPPPKFTPESDLTPLVQGDIIIWGGVGGDDLPPPKVDGDPNNEQVGSDAQVWGLPGLIVPDPVTGLTP